jgi:hypothetical protein
VRTGVLFPARRRSLLALLKTAPRAHGWCRTRWSGATLALTLEATRGLTVSAETMRRWLHDIGWVWKRAIRVAKDAELHRVERLARIRLLFEPLKGCEAMVFANEWDIQLWPKGGCAWMPKGTSLELSPGPLHHCLGPRQTNALFRERLDVLEPRDPADR